jgi:hypothetical protein
MKNSLALDAPVPLPDGIGQNAASKADKSHGRGPDPDILDSQEPCDVEELNKVKVTFLDQSDFGEFLVKSYLKSTR